MEESLQKINLAYRNDFEGTDLKYFWWKHFFTALLTCQILNLKKKKNEF